VAEQGGDDQERTESATPKRLEEARRQGQVPRSRDLNAAAVTLFSCGAISMFGYRVVAALSDMMRHGLSLRLSAGGLDDALMLKALGSASMSAFMAVLPILAAGFVAAILAPMSLSGWNFSTESLAPQFSRLNPIAGIGRMFAITSWIQRCGRADGTIQPSAARRHAECSQLVLARAADHGVQHVGNRGHRCADTVVAIRQADAHVAS
jgi:flagellar biosynthetic protein FlhB